MIRAHRLRGLTQIFFNSENFEIDEKSEKFREHESSEWVGMDRAHGKLRKHGNFIF